MTDYCFDQPIHRLMNTLSSKSPQLYIFWVKSELTQENYNHLYTLCSEKQTEIEMLRIQVERIRSEKATTRLSGPSEIQLSKLKEKLFNLQKQNSDLRADTHRWKSQIQTLTLQNQTLVEENKTYQQMTRQFKEQNTFQRTNIEQILQRLKQAENDLRGSRVNYAALEEANDLIEKSVATENKCRVALMEKDSQVKMMVVSMEEMKITFERVLTESLRSMKNKLISELPNMLSTCKTVRHKKEIYCPHPQPQSQTGQGFYKGQ